MKIPKHQFLKGALAGALIMLLCILGVSAVSQSIGALLPVFRHQFGLQQSERQEILTKLNQIDTIISNHFLFQDEIDRQALMDGIFQGYVAGLGDPFSSYYNVEQATRLMESTRGQYVGVGAGLSWDPSGSYVQIIRVFNDSPAQAAGLKEGDLLYQVDDQMISGQDLNEIVSWVRGEDGTEVVLHVIREGKQLSIPITRGAVNVQSVDFEMLPDQIGLIRVSEFDMVTIDQFEQALMTLTEEGMEGLIVDLRNNPGGSIDTVVAMLNLICPEGPLVSTVTKDGIAQVYESTGDHEFVTPLVVLVNQFSASASEIFAGAVQDYQVGTVLGTTTFGKGIVQQLIPLGDGTILRLTVAEYFTPLNRSIHHVGITPDIEVEFQKDEAHPEYDNQLEAAIQYLLNHR